MVTYKLNVKDRSYSACEIYDVHFNKVSLDINPIECKLFANDEFIVDKHNTVTITTSPTRCGPPLPGVLILAGNKTYGRQNGKKGPNKLLYKCIPDDIRLPAFLVPYEIKNMGFLKVFKNMYVTFTFEEWDDKHPRGKLDNVIGPVDILENFYEYQLFCKGLNMSIQKFHKDTSKKVLESSSHDGIFEIIRTKYPSIQDRTDQQKWHIMTIDPLNSKDFDDGFSIIEHETGVKQLSIYISNVTILLDALQLWESFSSRVSTIYLPDKKRPMMPTMLSDVLCSLQESVTRVAFTMDIFIKNDEIIDIQYVNCFVKVIKNYCYEEPKLLSNKKYGALLHVTRNLSLKYKYISSGIEDSHDVVCYLMILMNYYCAKELLKYNTGVFRSTIMKREYIVPETIPKDVGKFIKIMNSASGQYVDGSTCGTLDTRHDILELDAYIHITSPIRRIVDLLNMIKIQQCHEIIQLSADASEFYNKWLENIDYINKTMRSIRNVQNDSALLEVCHNHSDIMKKVYSGYIYEKTMTDDGMYMYNVFLPEIKLSSRIKLSDNFENFECKNFQLYLFNNEEKFKRKIRLQIV